MQQLKSFQGAYNRLEKEISEYFPALRFRKPYLAIVCADGDNLGKLQQRLTLDELQSLSRFLSGFAQCARSTVVSAQGECIYAGGDELLALLPLDTLWECLNKLRKQYVEGLANLSLDADSDYSIGVAIVHAFERDALPQAREALALAKNVAAASEEERRKALGIIYKPRSGAAVRTRLRWQNQEGDARQPTTRLQHWVNAYRAGGLPGRTPYLLRQLLVTHSWAFDNDYRLLQIEIQRLLRRRESSAAAIQPLIDDANSIFEQESSETLENTLTYWTHALLIARLVAEAYP